MIIKLAIIADKKLQDKTILATKLSVGTLPEMGHTMNHLICMVVQKRGGGGGGGGGGVHIARRT